MTATRKERVAKSEQIRLINECRKSGMTDADWCREHDIAPSTFYNWIHRCRKAASDQIPAPSYGHHEVPQPRQDVVAVDIVPDRIPELAGAPACTIFFECFFVFPFVSSFSMSSLGEVSIINSGSTYKTASLVLNNNTFSLSLW